MLCARICKVAFTLLPCAFLLHHFSNCIQIAARNSSWHLSCVANPHPHTHTYTIIHTHAHMPLVYDLHIRAALVAIPQQIRCCKQIKTPLKRNAGTFAVVYSTRNASPLHHSRIMPCRHHNAAHTCSRSARNPCPSTHLLPLLALIYMSLLTANFSMLHKRLHVCYDKPVSFGKCICMWLCVFAVLVYVFVSAYKIIVVYLFRNCNCNFSTTSLFS